MNLNEKVFGIRKGLLLSGFGLCLFVTLLLFCVRFCQRSFDVDIDAKRNRVNIQLVSPKNRQLCIQN